MRKKQRRCRRPLGLVQQERRECARGGKHSSDLELEVLHLTLEEYLLESAGPESPDKQTGQTEEVQLPAIKSVHNNNVCKVCLVNQIN